MKLSMHSFFKTPPIGGNEAASNDFMCKALFRPSLEVHQLASNMSGYGSIYGDYYGSINGRRRLIRSRLYNKVNDNGKGKSIPLSDNSQQNGQQKKEGEARGEMKKEGENGEKETPKQ
ncbi:hypothetical protein QYF36_021463 [Acer negundo]|nr:hypothetical protein QYF36_021463 [Acer negundo]